MHPKLHRTLQNNSHQSDTRETPWDRRLAGWGCITLASVAKEIQQWKVESGHDWRSLVICRQTAKLWKRLYPPETALLLPGGGLQALGISWGCGILLLVSSLLTKQAIVCFIYLLIYWRTPPSINNEDREQSWLALHTCRNSSAFKNGLVVPWWHHLYIKKKNTHTGRRITFLIYYFRNRVEKWERETRSCHTLLHFYYMHFSRVHHITD